jgi:hypothetical protein
MCQDQKMVVSKMIDMQYSQEGSSTARSSSKGSIGSGPFSSDLSSTNVQNRNISESDHKFIQNSIREQAIIKILENGVRLCLKLQTSHIASMYFETWMDKKKREDMTQLDESQKWLN